MLDVSGNEFRQLVSKTKPARFKTKSSAPRSRSFALLVSSLILMPFSIATLAQEEEPEENPQPSSSVQAEITVTSTLPGLPEEDRIDRGELESRAVTDLGEGLRQTAGLAAVRRGPINLDPSVRGLQEGQVGVFVNGTRTLAAGPGRMDSDLSHASLHSLQSVRVVKGPYALAWGAGTLSAIDAVSFKPKFQDGGFRLGGRALASYEDTRELGDIFGQLHGSGNRLRFVLSGGYREGSDYEDGDGKTVPGDFESDNVHGTLSLSLGNGLLEYIGGYQGQDDIDYPGRLLDATYFKTRSHKLSYAWTRPDSAANRVTAIEGSVYSNHKDHLMNNDEKPTGRDVSGRVPPFALDISLPAESNTEGGALRIDLGRLGSAADSELSIGADYYQADQFAERFIRRRANGFLIFKDFAWPKTDLEDLGVYAQFGRSTERGRFGIAVRWDQNEASAATVSDFFREATSGSLSRDEDGVSFAVSGAYQLSDIWEVHGGIGRATRNPSTLELYADRFPSTKFQLNAEFLGDPGLEAETSDELNLGVLAAWSRFTLRSDIFYREISDYITVAADPSLPKRLPLSFDTVYRHVNGTDAIFWGGELRLDHRTSRNVRWHLSVDSVRGIDELFDEPVLGLSPLRGTAGLRLQTDTGRFWGEAEITAVDRQDRVAASRFEKPTAGYELLSANFGTRLAEGLEVSLLVRNLTDETYADHLNAPSPFGGQRIFEPGRSVGVSLRYTY